MSQPTATADLPQELTERLRGGDATAMDELHKRYGAGLLAFLRPRCLGKVDACDMSQDIWLRVWQRREQFLGGNFRAWIYAIARNALADQYRHLGRRPETTVLPTDADFVARIEETSDGRLQALRDCLQSVGGDFVNVLRQRLEGVPVETIAQQLGITVSTVYTRTDRGKKALRDCIEQKS